MKRLILVVMAVGLILATSCAKPAGTSGAVIPVKASEIIVLNNGGGTISAINEWVGDQANLDEMMKYLDSERTAYAFDIADGDILRNLVFVLPVLNETKDELEKQFDDRGGNQYFRAMDSFVALESFTDGDYLIASYSPDSISSYLEMDKVGESTEAESEELILGFLDQFGEDDLSMLITPASVDILIQGALGSANSRQRQSGMYQNANRMVNAIDYIVATASALSEKLDAQALVYMDGSSDIGTYFNGKRSELVEYAPVDPTAYVELNIDPDAVYSAFPEEMVSGDEILDRIRNGINGSISVLVYQQGKLNLQNPMANDFKAAIFIGLEDSSFVEPLMQQNLGMVPSTTNISGKDVYYLNTGMGKAVNNIYIFVDDSEMIVANNKELMTVILMNADSSEIGFGDQIELETGMNRLLNIAVYDQEILRMLTSQADLKVPLKTLNIAVDGAKDYSTIKLNIEAEK